MVVSNFYLTNFSDLTAPDSNCVLFFRDGAGFFNKYTTLFAAYLCSFCYFRDRVVWLLKIQTHCVRVGRIKSKTFVRRKFPLTTSPGLYLFRISISGLTNTICNCIIQIKVTCHKGCLITCHMHVSFHKTHPGKARRKVIYTSSIEQCT